MYEETFTEVFIPEGWDKMSWEERVQAFLASEDTPQRFNWPFPMAVFGTLRQYQGNNRLMVRAKINSISPAFLPHFKCRSLGVYHEKNATAPFEIFTYDPNEWSKMLYRVDCLEGFNPERDWSDRLTNAGGYYRTLAWLRQLPPDYVGEWFPKNGGCDLWGERSMKIAPKEWDNYPKIPAWVYSSLHSNRECRKVDDSPVIWPK